VNPNIIHRAWCNTHRKILYPTRKDARRARNDMPWEPGLRAFKCPTNPDLWHVGHIPVEVRAGRMTMAEFLDGAR
jgi:hypothetical protein